MIARHGGYDGRKEKGVKANVPGGRYYEPQEERTEKELEKEWHDFQKWVDEHDGIEADPELPFN